MPSTPTCPTCEVPMEGGFLLDHIPGPTVALWVEGPPERNFLGGLKLKRRRQLPMHAWRCPRCSEVRLFAPQQ